MVVFMSEYLKVINSKNMNEYDFKIIRETKTKWICTNGENNYQFSKRTLRHVGFPKDDFIVDRVVD